MHNGQDTSQEYDVVVVGSGAGGMTAALVAADHGLSVLVVEKTGQFGGTSALSGGGLWVPNNHYFKAKGGQDSYAQALSYLKAAIGGRVDEARLHAYLAHAPQMVQYLEQHSRVRYAVAEKYPDYYPHLPGALPGGRTLDPELFDLGLLGDELGNLREISPGNLLMGRIGWTARDAHKAMSKAPGWRWMVLWLMLRYKLDVRWRKKTSSRRDRRAALGNALVASLRVSLLDRQVPLWLDTGLCDLLQDNGRVSGVVLEQGGTRLQVHARKAVILASGGFEQNQALRERYLPQPTDAQWSATMPAANTGAALEAGQRLGAATDLLDQAWWVPSLRVPGEDKSRGIFAERAFPGAIVVNALGRRFINEAAPYLEFGQAMYLNHQATGGRSIPAWVIFDSDFRFRYAMGPLMPAQIVPDSRLRASWLNKVYWKAETLDALAGQIGVDAGGLNDTVARINRFAASGVDEDFGRGGNVFDRYYGDSNIKPNPCLAAIAKAPFYAMRIHPGDIGTKGGLLTNAKAQVLHENGPPIAGLYAIGNCSASVMGTTYPGAGATLGPAMTFGYIAARHIAGAGD